MVIPFKWCHLYPAVSRVKKALKSKKGSCHYNTQLNQRVIKFSLMWWLPPASFTLTHTPIANERNHVLYKNLSHIARVVDQLSKFNALQHHSLSWDWGNKSKCCAIWAWLQHEWGVAHYGSCRRTVAVMNQQDGVLGHACYRAAPCSFSRWESTWKHKSGWRKILLQCEELFFVIYRRSTHLHSSPH